MKKGSHPENAENAEAAAALAGPPGPRVTPSLLHCFTCCSFLVAASAAHAQGVRIEIVSREPAPAVAGAAGPYEILRGRIHGEVDPRHRLNRIIQDLDLAPRNARGMVEYVATFAIAKPIDVAKASGLLIYSVVNRGNGNVGADPSGHVWLVSGWQGDVPPTATNQTIRLRESGARSRPTCRQ